MAVEVSLENDVLTISTGRCCRTWQWHGGNLISRSLADLTTGETWSFSGEAPDLWLKDEATDAVNGNLTTKDIAATASSWAHTEATVSFMLGELEIKRVFKIYDQSPALTSTWYMRGKARATSWLPEVASAADLRNIENLSAMAQDGLCGPAMERLVGAKKHLRVTTARFYDITDRRNNLVEERHFFPYNQPMFAVGNVALAEDQATGQRLFFVKDAPCSDVQQANPGADFSLSRHSLAVMGIGLEPDDLDATEWHRGYGCALGIGGEKEIRQHQRFARTYESGRDSMILVNTWGDRGQDSKLCESFALAEVEAAARLGASHLQLDDGWQKGQSCNSAFAGGSLDNIWDQPDYWTPHDERFPNGLTPIRKRADELGVELCLWFNPSKDDSYANWEKDAQTLIRLFEEYGIRTFKIDGVLMPDHRANRNLRAMFDTAMAATKHRMVFNLDVTAGRRWGYHHGTEYGNIFVENRYTDWGNYFPHWTLRNLWQLSRYVPPQALQMEFLNIWRNDDKYIPDDPFRPSQIPFAYTFATTMMAQPLAWFESQNLPEEAFEIADMVRRYRDHQEAIHRGDIFPIGEVPCGRSWTGFQAITDAASGYLLIFRELHDASHGVFKLPELAGCELKLETIVGETQPDTLRVNDQGEFAVALPKPWSFTLLSYSC